MKHRCAFSYFNKKPTHKLVVVFLLCRSTVEQNMDLTVMSQLVSQRRGIKWDMRKWGLTWTFFAICCHAIKFYLTGSLSVSSKLDERTWSLADKTKKKNMIPAWKKKSILSECLNFPLGLLVVLDFFCMWCLTLSLLEAFFVFVITKKMIFTSLDASGLPWICPQSF